MRVADPSLEVRVGYLEHGPPTVADVATDGAVAVPLLLSAGYHVRVDLSAQAPRVAVTAAVGPDPRLADVAPRVVAAYLLAPGVFHDALAACGAAVVAAPIGAAPELAAVVLDRYRLTCQNVEGL